MPLWDLHINVFVSTTVDASSVLSMSCSKYKSVHNDSVANCTTHNQSFQSMVPVFSSANVYYGTRQIRLSKLCMLLCSQKCRKHMTAQWSSVTLKVQSWSCSYLPCMEITVSIHLSFLYLCLWLLMLIRYAQRTTAVLTTAILSSVAHKSKSQWRHAMKGHRESS